MKHLILALLLTASSLQAQSHAVFQFILNRFGSIELEIVGDRGNVRFSQGDKTGNDRTTFASDLKVTAPGVLQSAQGVTFRIEKLKRSVIHDRNRGINSGNYRLTIRGKGRAFEAMEAQLPYLADFAHSGERLTFYGARLP